MNASTPDPEATALRKMLDEVRGWLAAGKPELAAAASEAVYKQLTAGAAPATMRAEWAFYWAWALQNAQRLSDAIEVYRLSLECLPSFPAANNLGNIFRSLRRADEAEAAYRWAVSLRPGSIETELALAELCHDRGDLEEAEAACRRVIDVQPDCVDAVYNIGVLCQEGGRVAEAVSFYRRALQLQPNASAPRVNLLLSLHYLPETDLAILASEHAQWNERHARPLRESADSVPRPRSAAEPIRLGFVSADFNEHPVGRFFVGCLEGIDQEGFPVSCYSTSARKDGLTARIRRAAWQWRDIESLPDGLLAATIAHDQIDILFDLAGHTQGNRLLVFARRPAPLQVAWIAYPGTTGLETMDYLLADRYQVLPEEERHYVERVLRMPDGYVCWDPPGWAPSVGPLPARANGYVTFASFNNPAKLSSPLVEVWGRILRAVPTSRLSLCYPGLDRPPAQSRLGAALAAAGTDPSRLAFQGRLAPPDLMAEYGRADVALDTFPYSGGATTCDALWMGLPVVTWPHGTFAGRHALAHLSAAGFTETITRSADEYVECAVALAGDLARLERLRSELRPRMAASPLCDGPRFARGFMELLRRVWQESCGR